MKRIVLLNLMLLVAFGYFQAEPVVTKHALIVAIGDYDQNTGWKDISSINDIELIKGALSKQGFHQFTVLRNEEADRKGIMTALDNLIKAVNKNDIVVVHFSSHGQQIMDDDGDEVDGYDEAIVAYGAPANYDPAYEGENHLRDEDLGEKLESLRIKLGAKGDVLVVVDACHSGTATRGQAVARGGVKPYAPEGYVPQRKDEKEVGMFEESKSSTRGNVAQAPMVVISAARADELNYEYEGYGSLSVAFNRAFENLDPNFTYRSLFSKIVKEMSVIAPRQTPALEGDVDRKLFGGAVVAQESYYNIKNVDDGNYISIAGGVFTGLNVGTTVKIYPAGTTKTKGIKPVTRGTIGWATSFNSSANLDSKIEGTSTDYWVFVDQQTFGDVDVKVKLGAMNKKMKKRLTAALDTFPLATLADTANFNIRLNEVGKFDIFRLQDGELFKGGIPSDDNFKALKGVLEDYVRGKFIMELEFNNPDYHIDMELLPVKVEGRRIPDTLNPADFQDEGGMMNFAPGDRALVRIINNGSFPVYFNIIDIDKNGVVSPVVPNPFKNEDPRSFKLAAGQSYIIPRKVLKFGGDPGTETFKVFASFDPINLKPIIKSKGGATRGVTQQIEKLFQSSYTMSRGVEVETLSAETDACTFSYTFKIIPRR